MDENLDLSTLSDDELRQRITNCYEADFSTPVANPEVREALEAEMTRRVKARLAEDSHPSEVDHPRVDPENPRVLSIRGPS